MTSDQADTLNRLLEMMARELAAIRKELARQNDLREKQIAIAITNIGNGAQVGQAAAGQNEQKNES